MIALSAIAARWQLHARPSRPHGIYAVGTVVRVKNGGRELMIMALRPYDDQHAIRPPSYRVDDASSVMERSRKKKPALPRYPMTVVDAAWLDASTDIVHGAPPVAWLIAEAARTGNPSRVRPEGVVVLFQNGTRIAVLVSPVPGDDENVACPTISLETRKWRTWACVHASGPTCCSTCRGAHPGRTLSTAELADRLRGGHWR